MSCSFNANGQKCFHYEEDALNSIFFHVVTALILTKLHKTAVTCSFLFFFLNQHPTSYCKGENCDYNGKQFTGGFYYNYSV